MKKAKIVTGNEASGSLFMGLLFLFVCHHPLHVHKTKQHMLSLVEGKVGWRKCHAIKEGLGTNSKTEVFFVGMAIQCLTFP